MISNLTSKAAMGFLVTKIPQLYDENVLDFDHVFPSLCFPSGEVVDTYLVVEPMCPSSGRIVRRNWFHMFCQLCSASVV